MVNMWVVCVMHQLLSAKRLLMISLLSGLVLFVGVIPNVPTAQAIWPFKKPSSQTTEKTVVKATQSGTSQTSPAPTSTGSAAEDTAPAAPEEASTRQFMAKLNEAANRHDVDSLLKHYAPDYISADGYNLTQLKQLLQDTWATYPEIVYASDIVRIRVQGDTATVESQERSEAPLTVLKDMPVGGGAGKLTTTSHTLTHLKKTAQGWEVSHEEIINEESRVEYGKHEKVRVNLEAPDQVFQGEQYEARVASDLPKTVFAIANLTQDFLSFPLIKSQSGFRNMTPVQPELSRVFTAGGGSSSFGPLKVSLPARHTLNEMVTATLALSELVQGENGLPSIQVIGLVSVSKRVNVKNRPVSKPLPPEPQTDLKANGQPVEVTPEMVPASALGKGR
jgi:ketosteroid isomerase-like protein